MYDRILVPTDGSAETRRVVEHAAELAEVHGAELRGLYVVNTATFAGLPMETSWEDVNEVLREEGESALADIEEFADPYDVPVSTHVVEGPPNKEIVRHAERDACDLVVMGTHGRGGIDRLLLGSVAERVVRSCSVPVMTVRVGDEDEEEPPTAESVGEMRGRS
mgnify:CR=1 FL=1